MSKTLTLTGKIEDGKLVLTGSSTGHSKFCGCGACREADRARWAAQARALDSHPTECPCQGCHDRRTYRRAVELEESRKRWAGRP